MTGIEYTAIIISIFSVNQIGRYSWINRSGSSF
ncbi:unnamed protein product [Schistosoma curassoni]|uniref:Uncharacterized protein n=1 Tax=Schistosoma curassoni TaxID=6186 RepID=A0A183KX62_9TREM|nr:unnamed protein product [Schistosoma curassoni]